MHSSADATGLIIARWPRTASATQARERSQPTAGLQSSRACPWCRAGLCRGMKGPFGMLFPPCTSPSHWKRWRMLAGCSLGGWPATLSPKGPSRGRTRPPLNPANRYPASFVKFLKAKLCHFLLFLMVFLLH